MRSVGNTYRERPHGRGPATGRTAVIGSGVAGLVAAHVLAKDRDVTIFEADTRLGGHAHTHDVDVGGSRFAVDSGFIVHNARTYPTLLRLFAELGVETVETEMTLSVRDDELGLEYRGGAGVRGLFPGRGSLRPRHLRMLADVPRFHRYARRLLASADAGSADGNPAETLEAFLDRHHFGDFFRRAFVVPLVAAVWSTEPERALDYPAEFLFRFLDNHGMLTVFGSPTWRTVVGGSRTYVSAVAEKISDIRTSSPVHALVEAGDDQSGGVLLRTPGGDVERFDAAVVATHPDQALALLRSPTRAQREILGALPYQPNEMILHTDSTILPRAEKARASWNHLHSAALRTTSAGQTTPREVITYDMNRLQHLRPPGGERLLVTLNGRGLVDSSSILASADYAHPLYTPESVSARARLAEIDSSRIVFAGAYHGWGFHEDGALAGLRAAEKLGGRWN
ncbi:NAD(P)/FAD-dependent oxidoreductase [Dietzia sp.]|uniref:NAD(P)/FAD-dependent oxidoreductase n=1 Tax=Dietzia sp. TaxID=1871616 RepID=UPI002FDA4D0C